MAFMDKINDLFNKVAPAKSSAQMGGGISSGHGMVPLHDDMIVSKPTIVFHSAQIFLDFLAMACFASVASFQSKWKIGPSGLTGFAIFVAVGSIFLSLFMLLIPVLYEKYDKFVRLARALKEVRVGFILTGTGTTLGLLIAFSTTISAWSQPGCKDPSKDPHEKLGDEFKAGLSGWCSTKKAGAIFFWLAFAFWIASLVVLIRDWRSGKLTNSHRDPPFTRPVQATSLNDVEAGDHDEEDDDDESTYQQIPGRGNRTSTYDNSNLPLSPFADQPTRFQGAAASSPFTPTGQTAAGGASLPPPRQSLDVYGAFSDPPPNGFGAGGRQAASPTSAATPPRIPEVDLGPRVSRTMQYADPYAAVRMSIAQQQQGQAQSPLSPGIPPSYASHDGYR